MNCSKRPWKSGGKSAINIRRNNLKISADVDDYAGSLDVAGLLLDDLEIASLRGKVEAASARIDLRERVGEGSVQVKQPRLSGISGDLLEADASWADRIVSLERATLKQSKSQYDADGDYALHDEIWDSLPGPRVVAEEVEAVETEAEEKSATDAVVADVSEEPVVAQPVEVLPHEEPPTEVAEHKLWKRLRVRRPAFVNNVTNRVKQLARNVGTKRSSSKREVIEEVKPQIPAPTQNESSVVVDPMDHQKPMVDEELNEPKPMEVTDVTHPSEEAVDSLVEDEEAPMVDEATETPKEDEASLDPVMATVEESSELAPKRNRVPQRKRSNRFSVRLATWSSPSESTTRIKSTNLASSCSRTRRSSIRTSPALGVSDSPFLRLTLKRCYQCCVY